MATACRCVNLLEVRKKYVCPIKNDIVRMIMANESVHRRMERYLVPYRESDVRPMNS